MTIPPITCAGCDQTRAGEDPGWTEARGVHFCPACSSGSPKDAGCSFDDAMDAVTEFNWTRSGYRARRAAEEFSRDTSADY